MTFNNYPESAQVLLTQDIRATASRHHTTPLHLWRTALKQVNPVVITVAPFAWAVR
jgi:hypothetical protein